MKKSGKIFTAVKSLAVLLVLCFLQTAVWAQDNGGNGVSVSITKTNSNWYAQPWVWVVGGAVFLLLLVALLRNNNSKN
jgi:hypothetical protein